MHENFIQLKLCGSIIYETHFEKSHASFYEKYDEAMKQEKIGK